MVKLVTVPGKCYAISLSSGASAKFVAVRIVILSSLGDKTVAGSDRSCISSASFGIQIT